MNKFITWWKNLKYWQKGGIIGFIIFLILYLEWVLVPYSSMVLSPTLLDYLLFDIERHLIIPHDSIYYPIYTYLPLSLLQMLLRYLFYPAIGIIFGAILDKIRKSDTRLFNVYIWWKKLKYWQRGGIAATTVYYLPIILGIINFISLEEYEPLLEFFTLTGSGYWLFMLLDKDTMIYRLLFLLHIFLLYPLLGILIGLIIDIIKRKKRGKKR